MHCAILHRNKKGNLAKCNMYYAKSSILTGFLTQSSMQKLNDTVQMFSLPLMRPSLVIRFTKVAQCWF